MQFSPWTTHLAESAADCLIVFVTQDGDAVSENLEEIQALSNFSDFLPRLEKAPNSSFQIPLAAEKISSLWFYRLPNETDSADKWREFSSKLAAKVIAQNLGTVLIDLTAAETRVSAVNLTTEIGIALHQAAYRFEDFKSKKKPERKIKEILFAGSSSEDIETADVIGESISLCKDLGNMPGNACTPLYLAEKAESLSELGISTEILDEDQMRELGMGSLLSVSAGSLEPARLITMTYQGSDENQKPFGLVGKGITFDTGGISLKPGAAMDEMKFDMCGAASVFGTVMAVAKLKLPINLVAVVAAAENMPSGTATKPGDIVTSMSGQTIEILNTDAEGRLVLCDALTYIAKYEPETIIDIATLTGACVIALGSHASGMYANDDQLAEDILQSANKTGDKAWRMPLWPEYDKQLQSNFADMANIGGREAGSVTAACFLARYTKEQKWAHLDIAGTAWKSGKAKGATGRPVRLLVDYLQTKVN